MHYTYTYRKTRAQVLEIAAEMVALARSHVEDVEFSAEDALRSDWKFLAELYTVAIKVYTHMYILYMYICLHTHCMYGIDTHATNTRQTHTHTLTHTHTHTGRSDYAQRS
jgi:uncharacterized membrane protein